MRAKLLVAVAVVAAAALPGWPAGTPAGAQLPLPTPTTAPPPDDGGGGGGGGGGGTPPTSLVPTTTPPPTPPGGGGGPAPSTPPAPSPAPGSGPAPSDGGSSGGGTMWGSIYVPGWALEIINAHPRTPPNDNSKLLAALHPLQDLGLTAQEAAIFGSGRFPIAGPAHFMDDFLFPRWGPAFRFHQGCDVMADYGTPVRSPAAGVARVGNSTLGGLSVTVTEPDGTYYYMAHLSGLAQGISTGTRVDVGQVVGFVGDSGNARGGPPHVHFEIHPQGGGAIDPKPVLDQWLLDAEARVPDLLAAFRPAAPAALVGTGLVDQLFDDDPSEVPTVAARAGTAPRLVAPGSTASTGDLAEVDWTAVARLAEWQEARTHAAAFLGPLLPPVLGGGVDGEGGHDAHGLDAHGHDADG